MDFLSVVLIAFGLSMDAFAVSVSNGICLKKLKISYAMSFGIFFGAFQFLMPIIGFYFGHFFARLITAYDHWIAFGLLALVGGKMLWETFHETEEVNCRTDAEIMAFKNLVMLAIATSIDALAIGVGFAVTGTDIFVPAVVIGIVAFCCSFAGVIIGKKAGSLFKRSAERVGGVILILIGLKILVEHLIHGI